MMWSDRLFGSPGANAGLGEDECGPSCECGGETWRPEPLGADVIGRLRSPTLTEPIDGVSENPYDADPPAAEEGVWAVRVTGSTYELSSYASRPEPEAQGGTLTHT